MRSTLAPTTDDGLRTHEARHPRGGAGPRAVVRLLLGSGAVPCSSAALSRSARLTARHDGLERRRDDRRVDARRPTASGRRPRTRRTRRPRRRRRTTSRARSSRAPGRRRRRRQRVDRTRRSGRCPCPSSSTLARRGRRSRRRRCVSPSTVGVLRDAAEREAAPRRGRVGQVLVGEAVPHLRRRSTSPPSASVTCWTTWRELDLQPARQVEVVLGLHDVGDAALAGLRVHPDDGLVGAADVLRVDRQVRAPPSGSRRPRRRPRRRRAPSRRGPC